MQTLYTNFSNATQGASSETREHVIPLGWQCGRAYASFYPLSPLEQQQQAAQHDADLLVSHVDDKSLFLDAWAQGAQATLASHRDESVGICPSCGQEDALLSRRDAYCGGVL